MDQIDVTRVMADIRTRASADLRSRTYDGGKTPEFSDAELFAIVEQILRNAVDDAESAGEDFVDTVTGWF